MLRNKRLDVKLLQRDVAVVLDMKSSQYSKMERGQLPVPQIKRWLLACMYRCKPHELFDIAMPFMVKKVHIGEWFDAARKRQCMTIEELAKNTNVTVEVIEKLINGQNIPEQTTARTILVALFPVQLTK